MTMRHIGLRLNLLYRFGGLLFFFVLCPDVYHSLDRHPFRIRRSRIETQSESQQDLGVSLGGVRLYNGSSNECSY